MDSSVLSSLSSPDWPVLAGLLCPVLDVISSLHFLSVMVIQF